MKIRKWASLAAIVAVLGGGALTLIRSPGLIAQPQTWEPQLNPVSLSRIPAGEVAVIKENMRRLKRDLACPNCDLRGADMTGLDLQGADLQGAEMAGTIFQGTNFQGANLRGGEFQEANLRGANLNNANLKFADISGVNLGDAASTTDIFLDGAIQVVPAGDPQP